MYIIQIRNITGVLFLFFRHIIQIVALERSLNLTRTRIISKSLKRAMSPDIWSHSKNLKDVFKSMAT